MLQLARFVVLALALGLPASAQGSAPPPVYDIWLCLGQSNMVGDNTGRDTKPGGLDRLPESVFVLDRTDRVASWHQPFPFAMDFDPEPGTPFNVSPAVAFARTWATAYPERPLLIVFCAKGGASLHGFHGNPERNLAAPGSRHKLPNNLFDRIVERVGRAIDAGGIVRGALWHQGEADAAHLSPSTYLAELDRFARELWLALPPDALGGHVDKPFLVGGMGAFSKAIVPGLEAIDGALQLVPAMIPSSAYVPAIGLTGTGVHFDTPSVRALGQRYFTYAHLVALDLSWPSTAPPPTTIPTPRTEPPLPRGVLLDQQIVSFAPAASLFESYSAAVQGGALLGSRLDELESFRHGDGYLYFQATWGNGEMVRWRQTSNPFFVPLETVANFELLPDDVSGYTPSQFDGLSRCTFTSQLLTFRSQDREPGAPTAGLYHSQSYEVLVEFDVFGPTLFFTPSGVSTDRLTLRAL